MAKNIVVGCKLPHGIVLQHPMDPNKTVTLAGRNKATIIGADHSTTEVDAEFWESWVMVNDDFAPLKSGAIFVAKSSADAAAMSKEFEDRKTGFEPMDPNSHGVKPADKD